MSLLKSSEDERLSRVITGLRFAKWSQVKREWKIFCDGWFPLQFDEVCKGLVALTVSGFEYEWHS